MKYFNLDKNKCLEELVTNENTGLTSDEAKLRLEKYGYNKLEEEKKKIYT